MRKKAFFFFLFFLAAVASCGLKWKNDAQGPEDSEKPAAGFTDPKLFLISQEELARKVESKQKKEYSFELVDLRLESDHQKKHIIGDVNIPLRKVRFLAEQMFGKQNDIVFYGYSQGDRSSMNAVILMINKGFEHVALLDGGIEEWKGETE